MGMGSGTANILSNPIDYLKGVGPQRADLLKKELNIFTFKDLAEHFPYRHIDKTVITPIKDITPQTDFVQVAGVLANAELIGDKRMKRLTASLRDASGTIDMVWFQGITWIQKTLVTGQPYLVFGRVSYFQGQPQLSHPEIEALSPQKPEQKNFLEPVYPSTEKLKARGLGGRQIAKLTHTLFSLLHEKDIPENLPAPLLNQLNMVPRFQAYAHIHFPPSPAYYEQALKRLKFEELFIAQL